ncbi:hypothetical protein CXB51_011770 [Gossypium anomalum]|uniref:DUF7745 domain-containing protein n=1 Tax=Gossypium anomalum TaxID=47600 RepID=A0A8J6D4T0_9ROSI|nr:hypothetical protein CXB51_011770 [Gossypium anomalum]
MEKRFLDRVEDNAAVRVWSERTQQEKGDSLTEGYESELWDFTRISFWNPAYNCFTFGGVDLVPTVEEYTVLLNCQKVQVDRAYSRPQKGDSKCISWRNLRDLILAHPDTKKRVDVFALSLYGLIIFPKALGHIDEAVSDLFDRLDKGTTPIPAILAETFRSLNECRRMGEGRLIGCAQLLLAWFYSHFWKVEKVSYRVFSKDYSPLRELVATSRRDDISEEKLITILQNWAPWFIPDETLYRYGDFDWVLLAGIWGAVGYAPLIVLRQYRSRQFIPVTQGLAQCEFPYKDNNYKRRVREISDA